MSPRVVLGSTSGACVNLSDVVRLALRFRGGGDADGKTTAPVWSGLPRLVERLRPRLSAPASDVPTFESEHVGLPFSYLAFPREVEYTLEEIFVRASYLPEGLMIPDGGVVIDAGANQGIFSVFASGLAERVRVFSFEPIPDIHAVLSANRALYGVHGHCFNAGLSHSAGRAQFTYYPGLSVLSGQYADAAKDRETSLAYDRFANPDRDSAKREQLASRATEGVLVDCELLTLSGVMAQHVIKEVHLLKVDVEKAELDVLRGVRREDWSRIHHVVVEAQGADRIREVQELLRSNGLDIVKVEDDPACDDMALIYARNKHVATGSVTPVRMASSFRCRELLLSIFEVEEVLVRHPAIDQLLAFPVSHSTHVLVLGVAIVRAHGSELVTLPEVRGFCSRFMLPIHLPEALVFIDELPGTSSLQMRDELAAQFGLSMGSDQCTWQVTAGKLLPFDHITSISNSVLLPQPELLPLVLQTVAQLIDEPVAAGLSATKPLLDAGLDSLTAPTFAKKLGAAVGLSLRPTLVFEYGTAQAIADHLHARLPDKRYVDCRPQTASPGADELLKLVIETTRQLMDPDEASNVSATKPLLDAGLDSLTAPTFAKKLGAAIGLSLRPTLVFEYGTAHAIADHLLTRLQSSQSGAVCDSSGGTVLGTSISRDLAVIGVSVRVSDIASASELASLSRTAGDAFEVAGGERWRPLQPTWAGGKGIWETARHRSFVSGAELFDNRRFGISTVEAQSTDPQQRLLLEVGYEAIHTTTLLRVSNDRVGVMVGIQSVDFIYMSWADAETSRPSVHSATVLQSVASGRLSFVLGLTGPCCSIDSACSASLVAVNVVSLVFHDSQCESAVALGVNLMLLPAMSFMLANASMLSIDGRCKTFDERANGYARSEAAGALVVVQQQAPPPSACNLHVCSSAVRQDGKSASLTAPNGSAQAELLREVNRRADVSPNEIDHAECHGTGTALGDPIETNSLVAVLLKSRGAAPLTVCGFKADIGHAEPAAGMMGLLVLATRLQRGDAVPNAQLRSINPHVDTALRNKGGVLPLQVATVSTLQRFSRNGMLLDDGRCKTFDASANGGVSSFGYSGTIAHAVLAVRGTFCTCGSDRSHSAERSRSQLSYCRRAFLSRDPVHPFAQRGLPSSDGSVTLQSPSSGPLHALVVDHVVRERVIFPGVGYLEMARAAGVTALQGAYFLRPLLIEASDLFVEFWVNCSRFEVRSNEADAAEATTVHCAGATANVIAWWRSDHRSLRKFSHVADVESLYDGFHTVGLQYGPRYRTLVKAWGDKSSALALLRARSTREGTQLHPADLDDALCTYRAIASIGSDETRLPFAVGTAQLMGATGALWAVRHRVPAKMRSLARLHAA